MNPPAGQGHLVAPGRVRRAGRQPPPLLLSAFLSIYHPPFGLSFSPAFFSLSFHFSSTPLGSTFSPSTPPPHRERESIVLRPERRRRHRLLGPADCPFSVCSVSWRAGSFRAVFMSGGRLSNFGPPEMQRGNTLFSQR